MFVIYTHISYKNLIEQLVKCLTAQKYYWPNLVSNKYKLLSDTAICLIPFL